MCYIFKCNKHKYTTSTPSIKIYCDAKTQKLDTTAGRKTMF